MTVSTADTYASACAQKLAKDRLNDFAGNGKNVGLCHG
jgi:hypothetical protein